MNTWEVHTKEKMITVIADDFHFSSKNGTIWFTKRIFPDQFDPHTIKAIFSPRNYIYCKRV